MYNDHHKHHHNYHTVGHTTIVPTMIDHDTDHDTGQDTDCDTDHDTDCYNDYHRGDHNDYDTDHDTGCHNDYHSGIIVVIMVWYGSWVWWLAMIVGYGYSLMTVGMTVGSHHTSPLHPRCIRAAPAVCGHAASMLHPCHHALPQPSPTRHHILVWPTCHYILVWPALPPTLAAVVATSHALVR